MRCIREESAEPNGPGERREIWRPKDSLSDICAQLSGKDPK